MYRAGHHDSSGEARKDHTPAVARLPRRGDSERLGAAPEEWFFWAAHSGAEIDCLWMRGRRRWGFEFKRTSAPTLTRSAKTALELLELQRLYIIHAGAETFPLSAKVTAVAASRVLEHLK